MGFECGHDQNTTEDTLVVTVQQATQTREAGNTKDPHILEESLGARRADEFLTAEQRRIAEVACAGGSHCLKRFGLGDQAEMTEIEIGVRRSSGRESLPREKKRVADAGDGNRLIQAQASAKQGFCVHGPRGKPCLPGTARVKMVNSSPRTERAQGLH